MESWHIVNVSFLTSVELKQLNKYKQVIINFVNID